MNSITAPSTSDEGDGEEAVADVERLGEHLVPLDCRVHVGHTVGDVRLGAKRAGDRRVRLEPQPLDVVAGARAGS